MKAGPVRLVITADDLGVDPRRDEGIFAAHRDGIVTQAGLLVGGPSAAAAACRARRAGLPLGLHLDLSEMPPLAPPSLIPTLLDGNGQKLGKYGFRLAMAQAQVRLEHIAIEAEAQMNTFAALTGRDPRHIDGHQHVHWIPSVAAVLFPLIERRGLRSVRHPRPDGQAAGSQDPARAILARAGVGSTEAFLGLNPAGKDEANRLRDTITAQKARSSVELMCHVGFTGTLGDDFNCSPDRERELEILRSCAFRTLAESGGLEMVSFHDLAQRGELC